MVKATRRGPVGLRRSPQEAHADGNKYCPQLIEEPSDSEDKSLAVVVYAGMGEEEDFFKTALAGSGDDSDSEQDETSKEKEKKEEEEIEKSE